MEKSSKLGGGFFIVLRIIKQRCDQLRVLVCSPDVGSIVGPKVWSLSYIFGLSSRPGGVFDSVLIVTKIKIYKITTSDFKIITGEKEEVGCDDLGF